MDEQRLRKRFAELTELSRRQNIYHYTEFLTPAEAADARAMTPEKARALVEQLKEEA